MLLKLAEPGTSCPLSYNRAMSEATIGVIGGSGLYAIDGLDDVEEVAVETPFGAPSDHFVVGTLEGLRVAFLPRHGRGHRLLPAEVNVRANIWAFKKLGVRYLIAVNACGSLREHLAPRSVVIPDQLVDHTRGRVSTFFGGGLVAHVGVADPFDATLSARLAEAAEAAGGSVHRGGRFVIIEGPRFSTRAESQIFRSWQCDIIGMTTVPEAFLAREAEIAYATMAHVTDYDVWHESEEAVTVQALIANLTANVELAREAIRQVIKALADQPTCAAHSALADAIFTERRRAVVPADTWRKLELLVGEYFD